MSALHPSPPKDGVFGDRLLDTSSTRSSLDATALHGVPMVDPLEALRSADHRPQSVIWRERLFERMRSAPTASMPSLSGAVAAVRPMAVGVLLVAVVVAVAWRLFVTSDPPVEDSIPIVQRNAAASTDSAVPATAAIALLAEGSAEPAPSTSVVVHVAGAVLRPGLVDGVDGWRVADAIDAAGGELPAADLDRLNLAAFVSDGQRIFVPEVGEAEPAVSSSSGAVAGTADSTGPVNLNTADGSMLETLPGVGPATAASIISHREAHGPFGTVDALVAVRGIGPATLEQLRDLVVVG